MKQKLISILALSLLLIFLTACKSSGPKPTATPDTHMILTQVAGTAIAQRTQDAGQAAVAKLTEIAMTSSTATSQAAQTQASQPTATVAAPTATPTQVPTATPLPPTATPIPPTPVPPTPIPPPPVPPTATPIQVACNWAMMIKDVSVPDGTVFVAGTQFTKTWSFQNIGTCKWTREYAVVYQSGEQMGADKVQYLEETIQPGETVDISIDFTAPTAEGKHISYWKLRNQNGALFGTGDKASDAFWVQIEVANPVSVAYNFANHICDAEWRTKDGQITCTPNMIDLLVNNTVVSSGSLIMDAGSVQRVDSPKLETGHTENEVAIVVHPSDGDGGYISGKYPERKIKDGDWFRTVVGCMYNNPDCKVTFKLEYQVEGGKIQTLGTWKQTYDGNVQNVDIDLSFLAGKRVVFILTVLNNGSSAGDYAFWLFPRIAR
jgi:hypothetical protein